MTSFFKPLLIAAVLAGAGLATTAQAMGGHQGGPMGQHQRMDPAKMQQMMAQRQADLKARLKITAAQEGAWNAYVASMQPPAGMGPGRDPETRKKMHEEMAALTTPQRIDRMNAMKAARDAAMAQRHDATKTFYAALTPEQQKVFDTKAMMGPRHGGGAGKHHGPRQG
jgi:protein CpxP